MFTIAVLIASGMCIGWAISIGIDIYKDFKEIRNSQTEMSIFMDTWRKAV
jgi:hypothetical protein